MAGQLVRRQELENVIQHLSHNSSGVITAKHILRDCDIHFIRRFQ